MAPGVFAIIVPDDAAVIDMAKLAVTRDLCLIEHRRTGRYALSPTVPAGWSRFGVKFRDHLETDTGDAA